MMLTTAAAAGGKISVGIGNERRRDQGKAEQRQKQDCRKSPQGLFYSSQLMSKRQMTLHPMAYVGSELRHEIR